MAELRRSLCASGRRASASCQRAGCASAPRRPPAACSSRRAWPAPRARRSTPSAPSRPCATTPWPSRNRSGSDAGIASPARLCAVSVTRKRDRRRRRAARSTLPSSTRPPSRKLRSRGACFAADLGRAVEEDEIVLERGRGPAPWRCRGRAGTAAGHRAGGACASWRRVPPARAAAPRFRGLELGFARAQAAQAREQQAGEQDRRRRRRPARRRRRSRPSRRARSRRHRRRRRMPCASRIARSLRAAISARMRRISTVTK